MIYKATNYYWRNVAEWWNWVERH